jgi:hypothetical protein
MVQNKEINKDTLTNGEATETLVPKLNGVHTSSDYSEDEDDYLNYLLVVPSLDKNVSSRNMNLITESLSNFYATIESKKEYPRIREELMGELNVPTKEELDLKEIKLEEEQLPVVLEIKEEPEIDLKTIAILPTQEQQQQEEIEVTDIESVKIKKFSLCFTRARFGKRSIARYFHCLC